MHACYSYFGLFWASRKTAEDVQSEEASSRNNVLKEVDLLNVGRPAPYYNARWVQVTSIAGRPIFMKRSIILAPGKMIATPFLLLEVRPRQTETGIQTSRTSAHAQTLPVLTPSKTVIVLSRFFLGVRKEL